MGCTSVGIGQVRGAARSGKTCYDEYEGSQKIRNKKGAGFINLF